MTDPRYSRRDLIGDAASVEDAEAQRGRHNITSTAEPVVSAPRAAWNRLPCRAVT